MEKGRGGGGEGCGVGLVGEGVCCYYSFWTLFETCVATENKCMRRFN